MSDTKFQVSFVLDGFNVSATFEGDCNKLRTVVEGLKKAGAEPAAAKPEPTKAAPLCPVHNKAMKVSTARPGSYFCTAKDEAGAYCKSKA